MEQTLLSDIPYRYVGTPLLPSVKQELIIELFAGRTVSRNEIVERVKQVHSSRGGLNSKAADFPRSVKKALETLKKSGLADNLGKAIWRISGLSEFTPEVTEADDQTLVDAETNAVTPNADFDFGTGDSSVYLYYFETYHEKAVREGLETWPCKIGRSDRDPLNRVTSQASTALPEPPTIAILFRTNQSSDWERAIHAVLRIRGATINDAPGTEWFDTSPTEFMLIVKMIDPSQIAD